MRAITWSTAFSALLAMSAVAAQSADDFPNRPIRIVVPFSPGGGSDDSTRFNAEEFQKFLNVPVLVENRPGASGVIAIKEVKNSPADGYTILMASNSLIAVNPVTMKDLPYDPFKDLKPVHGSAGTGAIFTVKSDSGLNSLNDVIERAKQEGRPLQVGTYSEGYQLLAAWLGSATSVDVTSVPYRGPANIITDLVGGRLDLMVSDAASPFELIRTGKLKGIAITSDKRDPKLPDVPTMKELGYPEFESYVWSSYYVLAETPDHITRKLADAISKGLKTQASQERRDRLPGFLIDLSLDSMGEFQRREFERFKKVAAQAKLDSAR